MNSQFVSLKMKISKEIIDKIYDHGKKESPIEACGYLAGFKIRKKQEVPGFNIGKLEFS